MEVISKGQGSFFSYYFFSLLFFTFPSIYRYPTTHLRCDRYLTLVPFQKLSPQRYLPITSGPQLFKHRTLRGTYLLRCLPNGPLGPPSPASILSDPSCHHGIEGLHPSRSNITTRGLGTHESFRSQKTYRRQQTISLAIYLSRLRHNLLFPARSPTFPAATKHNRHSLLWRFNTVGNMGSRSASCAGFRTTAAL
jgi:hypothetical protein